MKKSAELLSELRGVAEGYGCAVAKFKSIHKGRVLAPKRQAIQV